MKQFNPNSFKYICETAKSLDNIDRIKKRTINPNVKFKTINDFIGIIAFCIISYILFKIIEYLLK